MEEVDKIIIDSLRNLNCEISDEASSLRSFSADDVVAALTCCLEAINPALDLPKKMPTSMSSRLNFATQLVEHVHSTGFRGDLGYQTILYSNEIELRRVLMYLIEHLPRESNKIIATETIGYVPRLVKEIEEKVKFSLQKPWIPARVLYYGARTEDSLYFQQSFGDSVPLKTENICKPDTASQSEEMKKYAIRNLPDVTKQCPKQNLIPSLLFKDNEFTFGKFKLEEMMQTKLNTLNLLSMKSVDEIPEQVASTITENNKDGDLIESKIDEVLKEIETGKHQYKKLQNELKNSSAKLVQVTNLKNSEEEQLTEALNKYNIKSKTLTVLSKEDNLSRLKTLVENGNERLLDLANQWNEVQSPLIEEYRTLQSSLSQQKLKEQQEKEKVASLKSKVRQLEQELVEKDQLEKQLMQECDRINRNNNRSSYTKRILEIIGNIKKQDAQIATILKDTKNVQKEINQLTGKVDRSFTLSDSLIFKDAKYDETARRAYKLLATLHMDCESVIQSVTDLGLIERECRNLQDQIDAEIDKDMAAKLEQVISDIKELRAEREKHSKR